jgi:serine/threonine protein kinase
MFALDNKYGENIFVQVVYENTSDKELHRARLLHWFRNKQTGLAWALKYIMDELHKSPNLHNDISPGNILLHFPKEESQVYIGICNWGMATKSMEPMKSLYTFTDERSKTVELARRWWVDPRVAYVHKLGEDVQIIPLLTRASK